jgi:choline dehydrogenase-like flavoprotein
MGERFDAIVVGAGAAGMWAAKELTERGLAVALLDAGPARALGEGSPGWEGAGKPRGAVDRHPIQSQCYAFNAGTADLFVDDVDNPYTFPPEKAFAWIRSRQVGGRLHLWGKTSLRFSDRELKAASHDGEGIDWPLSHADLAPYYAKVERALRISGRNDGLPQLPDGDLVPPPPPTPGERRFKAAVEGRWPTRRMTAMRTVQEREDAPLREAEASGRLTVIPDAVVRRVLLHPDGARARGVEYVERESRREREVEGAVVLLCASALESTRLLLNSADPRHHPAGLGNSSGALGRYLMDHTYGIGFDGLAPRRGERGRRRRSFGWLLPSFRNFTETEVDYLRGFEIEMQVMPPEPGPRPRLRNRGRLPEPTFWMRAFGEVLPRFENRVSIDPEVTDAWGIPALHIECAYGENERRMVADAVACMREMVEAAGFVVEASYADPSPPGLSTHEMGTARMGEDPGSSVLDPRNRCWEVDNLYLTDAASFPSGGYQNPTLTIMALTVRACEDVAARFAGGELRSLAR